jgi:hypothetical protein
MRGHPPEAREPEVPRDSAGGKGVFPNDGHGVQGIEPLSNWRFDESSTRRSTGTGNDCCGW